MIKGEHALEKREEHHSHLASLALGRIRMILDAKVNHREGEYHTCRGQCPRRGKDVHISVMTKETESVRRLKRTRRAYGSPTASARHTPAEPHDWRDLSVLTMRRRRFQVSAKKKENNSQNPVNTASFARSLDMAPMSQYAYVCHMESSKP